MADFKFTTNGKADRSAANHLIDTETDIRQDVTAIKEDVVRLAQHLQSNNAHLFDDLKKSLDVQMKKAKVYGRDSIKQMETHVQEKPTQSMLVAFGVGFLASIFLGTEIKMKAISWLEQALVAGALLKEMAPPLRQSKAEKALLASFATLGLAGLGFLLYWGFSWVAAQYGSRDAALVIGVVSWIVAMICVAGFYTIKTYKRQRMKAFGKYSEDTVMNFLNIIEDPIRENPKLGILVAALAGYKAGQAVSE